MLPFLKRVFKVKSVTYDYKSELISEVNSPELKNAHLKQKAEIFDHPKLHIVPLDESLDTEFLDIEDFLDTSEDYCAGDCFLSKHLSMEDLQDKIFVDSRKTLSENNK